MIQVSSQLELILVGLRAWRLLTAKHGDQHELLVWTAKLISTVTDHDARNTLRLTRGGPNLPLTKMYLF